MSATRAALRPILKSAEAALDFVMQAIEKAGYKPGGDVMLALDPAATEFFKNGNYRVRRRGQDPLARAAGRLSRRTRRDAIRSSRSRTAWRRTIGRAGRSLTDKIGKKCQLVGDDLFVTNVTRLAQGIKRRHRQFDPDQGQPDRHADRDAGRCRDGAQGRLHRGDVASLRRDRGFHHRRSRGRHQLRADQDRLAGALRPHRQIQSAAAYRGGTRRPGEICRPRCLQSALTNRSRSLRTY